MCRYALKRYKSHFVCFDCRKTFKQTAIEDVIIQNGDWDLYKKAYYNTDKRQSERFRNDNPALIARFDKQYHNKNYKCPDCGKEMNRIGLDFKAPSKEKTKEWKIIEDMYGLGNTFLTCGCSGPGYIPKNKRDHLTHLDEIKGEYQQRLTERNQSFTELELKDYIGYWKSKLKALDALYKSIKL